MNRTENGKSQPSASWVGEDGRATEQPVEGKGFSVNEAFVGESDPAEILADRGGAAETGESPDQLSRLAPHMLPVLRNVTVALGLLLPTAQILWGYRWGLGFFPLLLWTSALLITGVALSGGTMVRAIRARPADRGQWVMLQALATLLLFALGLVGTRLMEWETPWVAWWLLGGYVLTMLSLSVVCMHYTRRAPLLT